MKSEFKNQRVGKVTHYELKQTSGMWQLSGIVGGVKTIYGAELNQLGSQTLTLNLVTLPIFGAIVIFIISMFRRYSSRVARSQTWSACSTRVVSGPSGVVSSTDLPGGDGPLQLATCNHVHKLSRAELDLHPLEAPPTLALAIAPIVRVLTDRAAAKTAALEP